MDTIIIRRVARKNKKVGESTIYLRLKLNIGCRRETGEVSTRMSIPTSDWNVKKGKIKGSEISIAQKNRKLDEYEKDIENIFDDYKKNNPIISVKDFLNLVKNNIWGISDKESLVKRVFILDLYDIYLSQNSNLLGKKRKYRYKLEQEFMKEFLVKEYGNYNIPPSYMDVSFYNKFVNSLHEKKRGYCKSTIVGKIKILKTIALLAVELGHLNKNPFSKYSTVYPEGESLALTKEELQKIIDAKMPTKSIEIMKDAFLFQCYTGLSYSDLKKIKLSDIIKNSDGWFIKDKRIKTFESYLIPFFNEAIDIIKKYENYYCNTKKKSDKLIPIINNSDYNKGLKLIDAISGVNKQLTTHYGRHTFATTIWLERGGSYDMLQIILGHADIRSTKRYGKITAKALAEAMKKVQENDVPQNIIKEEELLSYKKELLDYSVN